MTKYSIAPNGIFWTINGEGHLQGFQQAFLRLAGCSNAQLCGSACDTDFSVDTKLTLDEITTHLEKCIPSDDRDQWVWITGGEPADLSQSRQIELVSALKVKGWSVCVATSGSKRFIPPVDWLSVSPHSIKPELFQQRYGNEIKLVDGLGGLDIFEWEEEWGSRIDFLYRYAQPLSTRTIDGKYIEAEESLQRCLRFLRERPRWALSQQRHHIWGLK